MASIPFLINGNLERLSVPMQINSFGVSPVSQAFTAVAEEVMALLTKTYPSQASSSNDAEMVMIRATEPEYQQAIAIEPFTARELEGVAIDCRGTQQSNDRQNASHYDGHCENSCSQYFEETLCEQSHSIRDSSASI